jgi:hypothetical protein
MLDSSGMIHIYTCKERMLIVVAYCGSLGVKSASSIFDMLVTAFWVGLGQEFTS